MTFDDEKEYIFYGSAQRAGYGESRRWKENGKSSLRIAVEMSKLHRLIHVTGNAYDSTLKSALLFLARNIGWYRGYELPSLVDASFFYFMFIL